MGLTAAAGRATRWPEDLAARRDRASAALEACRLCPRDCGVDRTRAAGEDGRANGAWCRLGTEAWAYKELLSFGEEACVGPTWLVDLGGCSLRCLFCTEWTWVTAPRAAPGVPLQSGWFLRRLARHHARGARTLSFVGGEPTVNLPAVLRVLADVPPALQLPLVWNTNGLLTPQSMSLLEGLVHTWIVDLKVADDQGARRLLGAGDLAYSAEVAATLDRVHPARAPTSLEAPPPVIIRHLLMPGSLERETLPLIARVAARWPNAVLNVMTQYLPFGPALKQLPGAPELRQRVPPAERDAAVAAARDALQWVLVDGVTPGEADPIRR